MPIRPEEPDGTPLLVCINHDFFEHREKAEHGTTMEVHEAWHAIVLARPGAKVGETRIAPGIDATGGEPVRLFICKVCGYVEMYQATFVNAAVWGAR